MATFHAGVMRFGETPMAVDRTVIRPVRDGRT